MAQNRRWLLARKPQALVTEADLDFVTQEAPAPGPGEVLIRNRYISLDPGLQVYMASTLDLVGGVVQVGDVVRAWGVGEVVESNDPRFPVGSFVRDHHGNAGLQDYVVLPGDAIMRVNPDILPLPAQLGVLGMPALTAYFGLLRIGEPVAGDTVVVSGASGAVGSVAGQIARIKGCRAVGIAGDPDKCRYVVEELGFDACVDYKAADFEEKLAQACPKGINVYFDNVGGSVLDACLPRMALGGRIVFCGAVADYAGGGSGIKNYMCVLTGGLRWQGLAYHNYVAEFESAVAEMEQWGAEGRLNHREDIAVGLENFVPAFHRLFTGDNRGKLVLQVDA